MSVIPTGYCQCNLIFVGSAVPQGAQVVIGINQPNTGVSPISVAELVGQAWVDNILMDQVDDLALASVLCKFGPNATGPSAEFSFGDAGGSASSPWTPQVSILVQKRSDNVGGRSGRGRMFVPGYPEATADQSGLITGSLAGLQAEYDGFLADLDAAAHTMVILHATEGDNPVTVDALVVSPTVATQRRRVR